MIDLPSGYCLNADAENPTVMRNMSAQVFWNTEQINELKNREGSLPEVSSDDNGKILAVDENGDWIASGAIFNVYGEAQQSQQDILYLSGQAMIFELALDNLYDDIVEAVTSAHNIVLGILGD